MNRYHHKQYLNNYTNLDLDLTMADGKYRPSCHHNSNNNHDNHDGHDGHGIRTLNMKSVCTADKINTHQHHHHLIQIGGNVEDSANDDSNTEINPMDNSGDSKEDSESDTSEEDDLDVQLGGTIPRTRSNIFRSAHSLFIVARATDKNFIKYFYARLDKLKIDKTAQTHIKPHISMFNVFINTANPDHRHIVDLNSRVVPQLEKLLVAAYHQLSPQMYLVSKKGKYEIMGEFMAKVYRSVNSMYITHFRMVFYRYLENILGHGTRRIVNTNGQVFYVYSYNGNDLIAVPEYYHGKGVWTPHISLIKLSKLQKSNPALYKEYRQFGINRLISALANVVGSLDQINMSMHFNSLQISVL